MAELVFFLAVWQTHTKLFLHKLSIMYIYPTGLGKIVPPKTRWVWIKTCSNPYSNIITALPGNSKHRYPVHSYNIIMTCQLPSLQLCLAALGHSQVHIHPCNRFRMTYFLHLFPIDKSAKNWDKWNIRKVSPTWIL